MLHWQRRRQICKILKKVPVAIVQNQVQGQFAEKTGFSSPSEKSRIRGRIPGSEVNTGPFVVWPVFPVFGDSG